MFARSRFVTRDFILLMLMQVDNVSPCGRWRVSRWRISSTVTSRVFADEARDCRIWACSKYTFLGSKLAKLHIGLKSGKGYREKCKLLSEHLLFRLSQPLLFPLFNTFLEDSWSWRNFGVNVSHMMVGSQKLSIRRKPLSARHSYLLSPNTSFTAIMASGIGRSQNASPESKDASSFHHLASTMHHNSTKSDCYQDQWNMSCVSACEFDRLKNCSGLPGDMEALDHLFFRIYFGNDQQTPEEGIFHCDSESSDSFSEGDLDEPCTPNSQRPRALYLNHSSVPSPFSSRKESLTSSPSSSLPNFPPHNRSTIIKNDRTSYNSTSSSSVKGMYVCSGISGLVEQLSPILSQVQCPEWSTI